MNVLSVRWPETLTNESVYLLAQVKRWSKIVKKRRLKWFSKIITAKNEESLCLCYISVSETQGNTNNNMVNYFKDLNLSWEGAVTRNGDKEIRNEAPLSVADNSK